MSSTETSGEGRKRRARLRERARRAASRTALKRQTPNASTNQQSKIYYLTSDRTGTILQSTGIGYSTSEGCPPTKSQPRLKRFLIFEFSSTFLGALDQWNDVPCRLLAIQYGKHARRALSEAVRSSFPGPRGRPTTCTRPPNAAVPPPRRPLIGRPPPTTHEAAHGRQGNSFGGIGLTTMRTRVLLTDTTTTEVAYLLWLPKGGPVGRGEGGHPLAIQNGAVDRPGGHPSHRQPHVGPRGDHGREPKIRPSPVRGSVA